MYYDKQIRYIDYLENGEKQSNCGYVKIIVTDNRLLMEMQIRGLYETDDMVSEVSLEGAGTQRRIGTVLVRQGSGSFRWEITDSTHVGEALDIGEGLCYGQLERVHVQLSPRRSLRCVWREVVSRPQQESEAQDVGRGMLEYTHGDSSQTGFGDENLKGKVKKMVESAPEMQERAGDTQVYNVEASVLEAAAEKDSGEKERDGERTATGRTEPEKDNERTATGRTEPEKDNERTATGKTAAEGHNEGTATGKTAAERDNERTVTGRTVAEVGSEGIMTSRTAAERDGEGTMTSGTVTESAAAEGNVIGRTEIESPIMIEADSTGNEIGDLAGGKVPGETASKAGAQTEAATEEAELHQADASGVSGKTGITPNSRQAPPSPQMTAMSEDKWQQLWKIYPHIRPFQDEREYLSLRPEDFVILHSSAYRLAHNSFLLHGYFNYDHLILTQVLQRSGTQYYIGVPGNFYEKEKQVAIMYGFGSFECRREPAQEGDFGYYMIKVEL